MSGKKQYSFTHIDQPQLLSDQDLAGGLRKNLDSLETIFLSAQNEARSISNSSELTRQGKVKRLEALEAKTNLELREWRSRFNYHVMIKQVKEEMTPSRSRPDDLVAELRMQEIRGHLKSLDPIEQEGLYREV